MVECAFYVLCCEMQIKHTPCHCLHSVQVPQQGAGLPENFAHDWTTESNFAALLAFLNNALVKHDIVDTSVSVQAKLALLLPAMYEHRDYPANCSILMNVELLVGLSNFGFDLLMLTVQFGYDSSVKWLLENTHMDVNAKDSGGVEPFMAACSSGHLSVMELLYHNFNANTRLFTINGQTPLMVACNVCLTRREPGLIDNIVWLLNVVRVDVNEVDNNGMTALHITINHGKDGHRPWVHQAIIDGTFIHQWNQAQDRPMNINEKVRFICVQLKNLFHDELKLMC